MFTDADFGCGAKGSAKQVLKKNIKDGKDAERIITNWFSNIPDFDCKDTVNRRRKTSAGVHVLDAILCVGNEKINIEIKKGNSRYGGLQKKKDLLLMAEKTFTKTIVVRLKSYKELFGR